MDANGLHFWSLADASDWALDAPDALLYDTQRRVLRLRSRQGLAFEESSDHARTRAALASAALSDDGSLAELDPETGGILVNGLPLAAALSPSAPVSDLVAAPAGAWLVLASELWVIQRAGAWPTV